MTEKKIVEKSRNIIIYGLISFYGTERAKKCALYLYKALPHLYKKPIIRTYFDHEWINVVKNLREEYGERYRRLKFLKHPVVVFFNDQYIGDHRAIIHYVITEHRMLPDLPFPNLFPDFTDFLSKSDYKDYVYIDVRVGGLDDYVIGKMVFELHSDIVPKTCAFFLDLCKPFHEREFGRTELQWKYSYLGSTIRRICGNAFIQGGKIEKCFLRVKDENYAVKHTHRGVLSLCNEGSNNSTSEFCISLKENKWLDGKVIAFGQMIFGEPILAAIEEVATYYERPLKEIIIVGCGVIPSHKERQNYQFAYNIEKEKELINKDAEELRKRRIEEVRNFGQKVKSLLELSEKEKNVEYFYYEDVKVPIIEELGESIGEEREEEILYEMEEVLMTDFTLQEFMKSKKSKDDAWMSEVMGGFIDAIVKGMKFSTIEDHIEPLNVLPRLKILDVVDTHEVPSDELLEERFEAGLYSIPESLRSTLVKTFNKLTPSQLKLIGLETRGILEKGGVSEDTLRLIGSEGVISGLVMAVANVSSFIRPSESACSVASQVLKEIYEDVIKVIHQRGPELVSNFLISGTSDLHIYPRTFKEQLTI